MNFFNNLFTEGNEKQLYAKCQEYYKFLQEYLDKKMDPPPREMAQKLGLRVEEYSELLSFISDGGMESLITTVIHNDFNNGADFIPEGF